MNSEVDAFLHKARESQKAAAGLLRDGYADFAASRAYYAMFYATQAILLTKGLSFSSHSAVHAAFGREFAKPGLLDRKLHRYLLDAQDERNIGDYGTGGGISLVRAEEILRWTEEFLTEVENFLKAKPGS